MSELNYQVYGLKEGDTEMIRYIGITKNRLKDRLRQHIADKNRKHKTNWIQNLKQRGLRPEIELLEDGLTFEQATKKEVEYIKLFKSFGAKLVNSTLGGEGTAGFKMSDEHKEIMRQKAIAGIYQLHEYRKLSNQKLRGVARTDEVKKKISLSVKGFTHTEEAKEKMRLHQEVYGNPFKGRTHSEENKRLASERMIGKNLGESNPSKRENVRAKISASSKGKIISDEQKRKQSEKMSGRILTDEHKSKVVVSLLESNIKKRRPVIQCDLEGNEIQRFDYAKLANLAIGKKESDGNINAVCRGKLKTAYGFKWKYAN